MQAQISFLNSEHLNVFFEKKMKKNNLKLNVWQLEKLFDYKEFNIIINLFQFSSYYIERLNLKIK